MGRDHPYHFSNPFPLISMVDVGDLLIRWGSLEYFSDERGMGFSSSPLGSAVPVAAICFAIVLGPHIPTYGEFTIPWLYSCFSHFSGLQSHGYTVIPIKVASGLHPLARLCLQSVQSRTVASAHSGTVGPPRATRPGRSGPTGQKGPENPWTQIKGKGNYPKQKR